MPSIDFPPKPTPNDEVPQEEGFTIQEQYDRAREQMRTAPVATEGLTFGEQQHAAREALRTHVEPEVSPAPAEANEALGAMSEVHRATDATPKEQRDSMREVVIEDAMRRMKEAEAHMREQEEHYFSLVKEHQRHRGSISVLAESMIGEFTPKNLKKARKEWVQARARAAQTQQEATDARLKQRPETREQVLEGLSRYKGKGSIEAEKLRARYERMVTLRSVVIGAEEAELQSYAEGMNEREQKMLERGLRWYESKVPKSARIMATSALMVGASALVAGTGPVALLLAGGATALRVGAVVAKNPAWQKAFGVLSIATSVGGTVGLAAEHLTRAVHEELGTEEKAKKLLAQRESLGSIHNADNLEKLSRERMKALTVNERIARQGRWARLVSSVLAGNLMGHHAGTHPAAPEHVTHSHDMHTGPDHESIAQAPATHGVSAETAPSAPEVAQGGVPTTPDGIMSGATIHRPGEGFGEMVMEFKKNVHEQAGDMPVSPALKHILDSDPNALSREIGALTGTGSLEMHQGDQIFVDESQNVWFQAQGHAPQLIIENNPASTDGFITHAVTTDVSYIPESHPTSADAVPAHTQEDPSAALNRAQVGHSVPGQEHVEAVKPFDGSDIRPMPQPEHLDTTPSAPESAAHHETPQPTSVPETVITNTYGVTVDTRIPTDYHLPGGRIVAWGGDFQQQLNYVHEYIQKLKEAGKHGSILVEREYVDAASGTKRVWMYEFSTETPAAGVYRPDNLPIRPFGPADFIKAK